MSDFKLHNGTDAILEFLSHNSIDFKAMDTASFREWLEAELRRKERDATFQKRCDIRDIRKAHSGILKSLGGTRKRNEEAYLSSEHFKRLEEIEKELHGAQRAVDGLTQAVKSSKGDKKEASQEKLDGFVQKLKDLEQERETLLADSPEKAALEEAELAYARYKEDVGITKLQDDLTALNQKQAKRALKAGMSFEDISTAYSQSVIYPHLIERGDVTDDSELRVLCGVTLGVAHTEIDNIVVRYLGPEEPVDVLAVVEAKSNINDISSGFLMRQQNLGFLTGDEQMYEPEAYITKTYRDGRFHCSAVHQQDDEKYTFTIESFQRFTTDPTEHYFLDRLYFVARYRFLNGLTSGEYSRLMFRISNDINFDLDDDEYLSDLLLWTQEFIKLVQTKDILEIYAKKQVWAQQCLILQHV